jgi:hypothetical protein
MLDYDTNNRLNEARTYADRLASDMRRSRGPIPDEAVYPGQARLRFALVGRVGRMQRRWHAPAYQA